MESFQAPLKTSRMVLGRRDSQLTFIMFAELVTWWGFLSHAKVSQLCGPDLDATMYSAALKSTYVVLTGNDWPTLPAISGFIVTFGVLVALLAMVWRPKALLNYPLSLSLSMVGLLASYLFVATWGICLASAFIFCLWPFYH